MNVSSHYSKNCCKHNFSFYDYSYSNIIHHIAFQTIISKTIGNCSIKSLNFWNSKDIFDFYEKNSNASFSFHFFFFENNEQIVFYPYNLK